LVLRSTIISLLRSFGLYCCGSIYHNFAPTKLLRCERKLHASVNFQIPASTRLHTLTSAPPYLLTSPHPQILISAHPQISKSKSTGK
jgi:hypothetical protein